MKRSVTLIVLICAVISSAAARQQNPTGDGRVTIIPNPSKIEYLSGAFILTATTRILLDRNEDVARIGQQLAGRLRSVTGFQFPLSVVPDRTDLANVILLSLNPDRADLGSEGYELLVGPETVVFQASQPAGLFYAMQSFFQLLPPAVMSGTLVTDADWSIPGLRIVDTPRFRWRGMHLDVCRHFSPKEFVKKYIDIMSMYKLNTFHWHLTEDQGWRIEIQEYPLLTKVGGWRKETRDDGMAHGGFYTQEDIREVVKYAQERFITVVPEIEMPGHSRAALSAYPELSCSGGPFTVSTEWGIFRDVYCAGNEQTFDFLEDVLDEVVELFPGEYIHIGGDEVPKTRWENCVKCQRRIEEEGLDDPHELQSYFIRRIEKHLNDNDKRLIGWDEILEGGLAPNATVMSWRGTAGGIAAAKAGHDVVMSPTSHCYFDYYQGTFGEPKAIGGYVPLDLVYSYEPIPEELTEEESRHVLGAQGNMWTEYMPNTDHIEYMLLPRMCALSEVVWTAKDRKSYSDFLERIEDHYDRLAVKGARFRVPPPEGGGGNILAFSDTAITLTTPVSQGTVRYTLDGSMPSEYSAQYEAPLKFSSSTVVKAKTYLPNGRESNPVTTIVSRIRAGVQGVEYKFYDGEWDRLADVLSEDPDHTGVTFFLGQAPSVEIDDPFAIAFNGFMKFDSEGDHVFYLRAAGDVMLTIDGDEIINSEKTYPFGELKGVYTATSEVVPFQLVYKGSRYRLDVEFESPIEERMKIPAHMLQLHGSDSSEGKGK